MGSKTKVVILKYAESLYGENRMFRGGSEEVKLPLTFAIVYIQKNEYEKSGRCVIPKDRNVVTFEEGLTICDDINIVRIGGHTPDSCIVTFPKDGKTWVISGDECYHERSFEEMIPVGNCANLENSMAFLQEYGQEKYNVIVMHSSGILPGRNGFAEF